MEKKFRISFDVVIDSDEYSNKYVFEIISTEERIQSDIESCLENEFTFEVENLKVEEQIEGEQK